MEEFSVFNCCGTVNKFEFNAFWLTFPNKLFLFSVFPWFIFKEPIKFEWFAKQERDTGYGARTFKNGMTYDKIKEHKMQSDLFDSDFNECDSGYCGI